MKANNQPHAALDHTTRFRWEDGWRDLIRDMRIPEEVPLAAETASRLRQRLNARRRAEQAEMTFELLAPLTGQLSAKSQDRTKAGRYAGVAYHTTTGMWEATITYTGAVTRTVVGQYDTEEAAARARDLEILRHRLPIPLAFPITEYDMERGR